MSGRGIITDMNPELPQVRPNPEAMPQIPGSVEYFPDGTVRSPEVLSTPERQPAPVEGQAGPAQAIPPVVPVAQPGAVPAPPTQSATLLSTTPATAADDDLIEKEWVDKAKKIIAVTKGRPYEQAKAIALLQADYLKKRHNRELGGGV